jgi:hypothetical protein
VKHEKDEKVNVKVLAILLIPSAATFSYNKELKIFPDLQVHSKAAQTADKT